MLNEARCEVVRVGEPQCKGDEKARRGAAAQRRVERGQISRARQELTWASLAPKNDDTLTELRSKRPQEVQSPIPQHVLDFVPESTDANPLCTVLSIDGVGAYDHVFRSSMMCEIWEVPGLRSLLPFVRSVYQHPSQYIWEDSEGRRHVIEHEGAEQGDPLMPLLFSLAIHNALVEVQANLRDEEHLFAFLDDVVCSHLARTGT